MASRRIAGECSWRVHLSGSHGTREGAGCQRGVVGAVGGVLVTERAKNFTAIDQESSGQLEDIADRFSGEMTFAEDGPEPAPPDARSADLRQRSAWQLEFCKIGRASCRERV